MACCANRPPRVLTRWRCACAADPQFSFFAEALRKAHLADRLARSSNWTVFVPNDIAFAATLDALGLSKASLLASKELLDALVRMHIAPGRVPSNALRPGATVESLEGSRLRVTRAPAAAVGISVAGADVLRADIAADNGVIHGTCAACRLVCAHLSRRSFMQSWAPSSCQTTSPPSAVR